MRRMTRRLGLATAAASLSVSVAGRAASLPVLLPDDQNLQFMAFWLGIAGAKRAGVTPTILTPEHRRLVVERFTNGAAPLAILPAPLYQALIADGVPMRIVANLLRNEPLNLVLRREVAAELPPLEAPLDQRLAALSGRRIGIAPGPVKRLHAMLAAGGFGPEHVTRITVPGHDQNEAFGEGDVDGILAHTPYLERAIVDQGGALYLHLSKGEVPALRNLLVHALVAAPAFLEQQPDAVVALLRAMSRSRHTEEATRLLRAQFPSRPAAHLATIAKLLGPALPRSLRPTVDAVLRTAALFPSLHRQPIPEAALAAVVDDRFAVAAESSSRSSALAPVGALLAGGAAGWLLQRRRARGRGL